MTERYNEVYAVALLECSRCGALLQQSGDAQSQHDHWHDTLAALERLGLALNELPLRQRVRS